MRRGKKGLGIDRDKLLYITQKHSEDILYGTGKQSHYFVITVLFIYF